MKREKKMITIRSKNGVDYSIIILERAGKQQSNGSKSSIPFKGVFFGKILCGLGSIVCSLFHLPQFSVHREWADFRHR